MSTLKNKLIPILTTDAGGCLTSKNWEEVGVEILSCYLSDLLLKPGFHYLKESTSLSHYLGWNGNVILNATSLMSKEKNQYLVRSRFDGSIQHYSIEDIVEIFIGLKPQYVLFPKKFYTCSLSDKERIQRNSQCFIPLDEIDFYQNFDFAGVYYIDANQAIEQKGFDYKDKLEHRIQFWIQDKSIKLENISFKTTFVETDAIASDACQGKVYCDEGVIDLLEEKYANQFELIQQDCLCPTCKQKLTRAYLHHLLQNTPLLCQRFLIQHNTSFLINN